MLKKYTLFVTFFLFCQNLMAIDSVNCLFDKYNIRHELKVSIDENQYRGEKCLLSEDNRRTCINMFKVHPLIFSKQDIEEFGVLQRMIANAEVDMTDAHRAEGFALFESKQQKAGHLVIRFFSKENTEIAIGGYFNSHVKCIL